ncbi:MAG: CvpA family protein [Anaerolineae bacterium]
MGGLSVFDLVYALVLLAGMAAGYARGFLRQLTEFVAVYVGLAVAAQYTPFLTGSLDPVLATVPHYVTSGAVFFAVVSIVAGVLSLVGHTLISPSEPGGRREYDRSDLSQISGLLVGALIASSLIAVSIPVLRYATAASWGGWDTVRQFLAGALDHSYMAPLFGRLTPTVLASIQPLLPGGLPGVLLGRLL